MNNLTKILMILLATMVGGCSLCDKRVGMNPFWGDGKEFVDIQKLDNLGHWDIAIAVAADGSIIAAGPMRSSDGGNTWEHIADYPTSGQGFIVDEATGDLMKLHSNEKPEPIMFRSKDNGKTWVKEDIIRHPDAKGWLATTMACDQGVTLKYGEKKGRLLMAARVFVEYDNKGQYDQHYSTALYSDDHGKSWHPSAPFPFNGTGEANLAELSDGRIYYNSRSHTQYGNRLTAISYDGGETWTDGRKCNYLPDGPPDFYGCKGGMVRLPIDDYDILIYSQNDDPGGDSARHTQRGRENLIIWASFDGGETWPVKRHLHTTGGYSSLAAGRTGTPSEGMIYLLCHKGFFARFNLAWITEGRDWQQFIDTGKK